MVTGALTLAGSIIILIDARKGVIEQNIPSRLSSIIESKRRIVMVNKMDLVDYLEEVYNKQNKS
jgi:bifunctional enzyme CysN/CysC